MQPKNILVIIIARFGDTLLITPVIRALKLRWPEANIDVLAHKKTKEILENISEIHSITAFSKGQAKWRGWFSRRRYDFALVYHSFHPGRFLAPQQHPKLAVIEHPIDYQQATRQDEMSAISVEQVWVSVQNLLENT
ncbi:hypothetical protein XBJ2_2390021 [Xenorhabdus bovienii str. Jollieti]|uniref:Glycosyltransferase family 9 protein n=1 Tax=Xenorhabdus bovienii (strain SS-2004) TaxID=406818 RepID=D3V730_XENBS|nr:hypothetical protein [Xenorhabdus bovienii]CBJ83459.1 hypothetical protein XBJ1_4356 [Xenorhabdus bovienii SS-2004]CDH29280.1 hypothetical protein XBJ2_2390021 [Xenorhabdus bovienii str. Jollieti]